MLSRERKAFFAFTKREVGLLRVGLLRVGLLRVGLFLEVRSVAPLTGSLVPEPLEEGSGKCTEMEYRIVKIFRWCKILQKWLFDYLS